MSAKRYVITAIGPNDAFYREGVKSPLIGQRFRLIEGEQPQIWSNNDWSHGAVFITSKAMHGQHYFYEFKYRELPARKPK